MRRLIFASWLLVACNNAGDEAQKKQSSTDLPTNEAATVKKNSANTTTSTAEELSPDDEKNYITLQEDSRFYQDAVKQFDKLSPQYLEQLYGQKVPDVNTLHQIMRRKLIEQRIKSGFKVSQPFIPAEWAIPSSSQSNTEIAEWVYTYGDIDNLGYGWPDDYDPFSGASTKPHGFPFVPEKDDPPGTDRIMVNSGYQYPSKEKQFKREKSDGYTTSTRRPDNVPETLRLKPMLQGRPIKMALLQIFVDDFQPLSFNSQFRCLINGKEAIFISNILNELKQGGPIGKLISINLLPEFFPLLAQENLDIFIDSPSSIQGDGFAIDFVRLLINPRNIPVSSITGKITDAKTRQPLADALVRVSGSKETQTNSKGEYRMENVPCGMVVIQAAAPGFKSGAASADLLSNKASVVNIKLEPETDKNLEQQLQEKGKIELYGIYFDTDKATLKPASEKTLKELLSLIQKDPKRRLEIGGHTDSEGDNSYNLRLSQDRSDAVLQWLEQHKAPTSSLITKGYGETLPVADNSTEAGRALNRRVEIKIINP